MKDNISSYTYQLMIIITALSINSGGDGYEERFIFLMLIIGTTLMLAGDRSNEHLRI